MPWLLIVPLNFSDIFFSPALVSWSSVCPLCNLESDSDLFIISAKIRRKPNYSWRPKSYVDAATRSFLRFEIIPFVSGQMIRVTICGAHPYDLSRFSFEFWQQYVTYFDRQNETESVEFEEGLCV